MAGRAPEVVLNGGVLAYADGGIRKHVRFLLGAWVRRGGPEWRVAIPAGCEEQVSFVPPEHRLVLPAQLARGFVLREILWNQQLSTWMRRNCPAAVLHNFYHFWTPRPPRHHVLTAHDCIETRFPERVPSRLVRLYHKLAWRLARRARAVVAVSDFTRSDVVACGLVPPEKFVTIHCWLEPEWARPVPAGEVARVRERYQLPARYVAYVGGYHWHKNVGSLLRAWSIGRQAGDWPTLVLAGARRETAAAGAGRDGARGAEIGLLRPGFIAEEDLPGFYAGAALFVSPSLHEGFGYPAVEATACGAPVLVGDTSAMRETVPAAHMRCDATKPEAIAERVRAALANPAAFRQPLDPRFTEEVGFPRYRRLIEHVLRHRRDRVDRSLANFDREGSETDLAFR